MPINGITDWNEFAEHLVNHRSAYSAEYDDWTDDDPTLEADIELKGLVRPLVWYMNSENNTEELLDGFQRCRICVKIGYQFSESDFQQYTGDDPFGYTVSVHKQRPITVADWALKLELWWRRELESKGKEAAGSRPAFDRRLGFYREHAHSEKTNMNPVSIPEKDVMVIPRAAAIDAKKAADVLDKVPEAAELLAKKGASVHDLAKVAKVAEENPEVVAEAVSANLEVIASDRKPPLISKTTNAVKLEHRRAEIAAQAPQTADPRFIVSPISELPFHVEANSIDAILTDPPYPGEYVRKGIYRQLAEFAAHALKDRGLLIVLHGQAHTPQVIADLNSVKGVNHVWTGVYLIPGKGNQITHPKVVNNAKLLSILAKGEPLLPISWPHDTIQSPARPDKSAEEWAQSVSGMRNLIKEWIPPKSIVCDPMCGAGSTPIAALSLGHSVICADIEEQQVAITRAKILKAERWIAEQQQLDAAN